MLMPMPRYRRRDFQMELFSTVLHKARNLSIDKHQVCFKFSHQIVLNLFM